MVSSPCEMVDRNVLLFISSSDLGIPPEVVAQIKPDEIIAAIQNFDENQIEKIAEQAEEYIYQALDAAEDSPMLENILSKIESYIPSEQEADTFISNVVEKVDLAKVEHILKKAEEGLDDVADKINGTLDQIDLPDLPEELDKVIQKRPDIEDLTDEHLDKIDNTVDNNVRNY